MVRTAAVAAGNADTAAAAVEVLHAGGNAVDGALAAGFAASVCEPVLSSLGGGGFLLAAPPEGGERLFDFFVDAPGHGRRPDRLEPAFDPVTVRFGGAAQVFHAGWGSVAVPGCLDGFLHVSRRLGRLGLAEVVAPAQRLATRGCVVDNAQAGLLIMLAAVLTRSAEGRAIFAPRGRLLGAGDRMRNEALAALLADVAAGRVTGIADPTIAGPLEAAMDRGGGLVTASDLQRYAVVEREPLRSTYRGAALVTNPPPSFGGSIVLAALDELDGGGPLDGSAPALARLVQALVGISERHVAGPAATRGTTHVSVVDPDGGFAAMTTSNGSCSGEFVPGTGIQLNNVMGEADLHPEGFHVTPPGVRIGSMMAPTLARAPDGRVVGLGSGGSERIRSALTCVLTGLLDRGLDLDAALAAPRLHWDREVLQVEPGLPEAVLAPLHMQRRVHVWQAPDLYFGGVNAVARSGDGAVSAAGDRRRGGVGVVLEVP